MGAIICSAVFAARQLRWARHHAGVSQRELSRRTGIAQSTISRIEAGDFDPGVATFRTLLRGCGYDLELAPVRGYGVDRGQIAGQLSLSADERVRRGAASIAGLTRAGLLPGRAPAHAG